MTIYPEIGYGASIMSDIFTEQMIFSESDDTEKRQLSDIFIEGFDFEEGYSYLLQVKKLVTAEPYSEKYVLLKTIEKEKA